MSLKLLILAGTTATEDAEMSNFKERADRLARSDKAAMAAIDDERATRDAKTASLRALRIAEEAKARPPVEVARRRKPVP